MSWACSFAPAALSDVVGQDDLVETLTKTLDGASTHRHLIIAGPAGVGKTSACLAALSEAFPDPTSRHSHTLVLNASDDRRVGAIEKLVVPFSTAGTVRAGASSTSHGAKRRIILMDEADALTVAAQNALACLMTSDKCTATVILTCNFASRLVPDLVNGPAAVVKVGAVSRDAMLDIMERLIRTTKSDPLEDDLKKRILEASRGDLRALIKLTQACVAAPRHADTILNTTKTDSIAIEHTINNVIEKTRSFKKPTTWGDVSPLIQRLRQFDLMSVYRTGALSSATTPEQADIFQRAMLDVVKTPGIGFFKAAHLDRTMLRVLGLVC